MGQSEKLKVYCILTKELHFTTKLITIEHRQHIIEAIKIFDQAIRDVVKLIL